MSEIAMSPVEVTASRIVTRANAIKRFALGDSFFHVLTESAAVAVLLILGGAIISLISGSIPAFETFGFGFFTTQIWNPVTERFGAGAAIFGTLVTSSIAMVIAVPIGMGIAIFLTELCPPVLKRPIGIAIELLAGIPSIIYGIWGLFVFAPFMQQYVQPALIALFGNVPVLSSVFAGPPYGIGMLTASLILAIMVLPFITSISRDVFDTVPPMLKESAYGVGCTTWEVVSNIVIPFTRVGVIGGVMLGARARARRDHGGDFRDRQRAQDIGLAVRARDDDFRDHRQRVHRGGRRSLHFVADRAGPDPVHDHLHRSGDSAAHADAARTKSREIDRWPSLSRATPPQTLLDGFERRRHRVRPDWLFLILAVLFWQGLRRLSLAVFTQMTPPPGSAGGLLNAIAGSLLMTVIGVAIGTPLGMLAGTYLAEYGRIFQACALVVRFINDILLSAPSIVIGLFVYEIVVAPMGHFSGWAGGVALAVLVVPVVVRTTEDMLNLVPNTLREAGAALGMPRSMVIQRIGYRAARAGMLTGVLLAIARVSGETAPLLFTSLNNQFWSTNLNAPDVEPAGGNLSVRAQPLQRMATARLDRRVDHHAGRSGPEHRRPRPRRKENIMNMTSDERLAAIAPKIAVAIRTSTSSTARRRR